MADATNERGYIMFRLDQETALKRVYDPYTEDIQYKELSAEFIKLIEKNPDYLKIESIESAIEAKIADITYSNGFHDGLQFVLKAIAGQEVIEL